MQLCRLFGQPRTFSLQIHKIGQREEHFVATHHQRECLGWALGQMCLDVQLLQIDARQASENIRLGYDQVALISGTDDSGDGTGGIDLVLGTCIADGADHFHDPVHLLFCLFVARPGIGPRGDNQRLALLCLAAILLAVGWPGQSAIAAPDRSAEPIYAANPQLVPIDYDSPALLPPTPDQGKAYVRRLTFICDSPTYWMWPFGLLHNGKKSTQIWTGPEGTMTLAYQGSYEILDPFDRVERPIREVVRRHKPDILVIAVGINGISFMKEDYFKAEYKDLVTDIQRISPNTTLILQSIYPITRRYKHWGNITNVKISQGNRWILSIAEETGCKYLDTFSVLLNEEGNARDELMMKDGLHPNKAGLSLILNYIRTHAYTPAKIRKVRRPANLFPA